MMYSETSEAFDLAHQLSPCVLQQPVASKEGIIVQGIEIGNH